MKTILLVFCIVIYIQHTEAQVCGLSLAPAATVAYVFTERTDLSMQQLFGETIPPALVNIIRINTPKKQQEVEDLVLSGKADGVFIFPGNTEQETIRYCSARDYLWALKKVIEDQQ